MSESPWITSESDQALDTAERQVLTSLSSQLQATGGEVPGSWVETYRAAGRAALAKVLPGPAWLYIRIDLNQAEDEHLVTAHQLKPVLNRLVDDRMILKYWILYKADNYFHIRLRLFGDAPRLRSEALPALMQALQPGGEAAKVAACTELLYEPETALFGGPWGLEQVHDLFYHDSRFVMDWRQLTDQERAGLSNHQVSVMMIQHLLRAAGLDAFERWDVYNKLQQLRPSEEQADLEAAWQENQEDFAPLLQVNPADLIAAVEPAAQQVLSAYVEGLAQVGAALWEGQRTGRLDRGLRQILATTICFHWNRMRFGGDEQALLAHHLAEAAKPLDDV